MEKIVMSKQDYDYIKTTNGAHRLHSASCHVSLAVAKQLINELATAIDDKAFDGKPLSDELHKRVIAFSSTAPLEPIADALPEHMRPVAGMMMHWNGIPVFVSGIVETAPENWPLIDANNIPPESSGASEPAP